MRRLFLIALPLLLSAPLGAQTALTATLLDSNNKPVNPLSAAYSFPVTAQGESSSFAIVLTNPGPGAVSIVAPLLAGDTTNFKIGAYSLDQTVAPGKNSAPFPVSFSPTSAGTFSTQLQVEFQVQTNGCTFGSSAPGCTVVQTLSTLSGTATAQFLLSYSNSGVNTPLQAGATQRVNFGAVAQGSSQSLTFTLTNETASAINVPPVTLPLLAYQTFSAFTLDTSALPPTLPANGAATFTIRFQPGVADTILGTLLVGSGQYGLQGTGTGPLVVVCYDSGGVKQNAQATAFQFDQLVPGTPGGTWLKCSASNSQTSADPVTLSGISVTGAGFTLSGVPSPLAPIQPGASVNFTITFSASTSGNYTGQLTVGTLVFSLHGLAVVSPVPALSLTLSQSTLTSAQQVTATVQTASASPQEALGQLTMQFTPSVAGISDDPAIVFLATGGRSLSLDLAQGAQTATFQKQSDLTFQTGTTAGTLTFTLTFPNTPPITQSYTITPEQIHISSASAVRSDPNLIVTINGFDNTYSAGQMSFTFYDTKGNAMTAKPMAVDASGDFHQYFFTNDQAGGSFAVQAKFPVTGDITQIGAVAVTLNNSAGQAGTKLEFQ